MISSACTPVNVGSGDTGYSLLRMADVVNKNLYQGKLIAPVMAVKSNGSMSLSHTSAKIHNFLYNNFQYKADASDQILRSLSCSWAERQTGIDCKSYSIAASIILSNLGISHAFRRVKQPTFMPNQYTHVYVIVFNNQKTQNLKDGYFVIDGTLPTMKEVPFLEKDDFHISVSGLGYGYGLGNTENGDDENDWMKILTELFGKYGEQINNVKNAIGKVGFWKALSCNRSAFDDNNLQRNLNQQNDFLRIVVERINTAIALHLNSPRPFAPDFNPVGEARNKAYMDMFNIYSTIHGYRHNTSWSSACTKLNLETAYKYALEVLLGRFHDQVLIPYLRQYFDYEELNPIQIDWNLCRSVPVGETCCGPNDCQYYRPNVNTFIPHKYTLKQGVTNIPLLEFSAPVINVLQGNSNGNSLNDIINSFQTLLPVFIGNGGSNSGGSTIDVSNPNNNASINPTNQSSLLSGNNLIFGLLIGGALLYGFNNKKLGGTNAPTNRRNLKNKK